MIRLGIVGCGAVAEICHLPAAELSRRSRITALADIHVSRAQRLAQQYGVEYCTDDYHDLVSRIDGVIIALPHHLHVPVALEFLGHGVPVLVEKPLAFTRHDANHLVEAAARNSTLLQAGYMYRFCRGARLVKQAVDEGWLGPLQGFCLESGYVYDWPVASAFNFTNLQAGGGVLIDTGSHMLDLLLWWLGDLQAVEYRDDAEGGIESDCCLSLAHRSAAALNGEVILSRVRKLNDTARVIGELFTIEYDVSTADQVRIWPTHAPAEPVSFAANYGARAPQKWNYVYAEQLDAFARSIESGTPSLAPGESVLPVVALIENCYARRKPLNLPWMARPDPAPL